MRPSSIVFLNDFCIRYIQSEIESLATHGASECWGTYNSTNATGWGPAYENSCIHSDSVNNSEDNTAWYNYTLASAGTITDKNTASNNPATNVNTATESLCPNGWTLPFAKQIDSNRNTTSFSPVLGGNYGNGTLYNEGAHGLWWGSEADNGARRYGLRYDGSSLYTSRDYRGIGFYIRCVSEEKTVTDLTYMQDMTPLQFTGFFICLE